MFRSSHVSRTLRASLGLLFLLGASCATPRASARQITVDSSPSGARVTTDCGQVGITPCALELPRFGTVEGSLELDGHEPARFRFGTEANPVLLLLGGVPGALVESEYGRCERKGNHLSVQLSPCAEQAELD